MTFTHVNTKQKIEAEKGDKIYELISTSPSWKAEDKESKK